MSTEATGVVKGGRPLQPGPAVLGDVGTDPSTKEETYAAVLAFVANTQTSTGTVAVTPSEVKDCTGVARRYADDPIEAMGSDIESVRVREATEVQTGLGVEQKPTALRMRVRGNAVGGTG